MTDTPVIQLNGVTIDSHLEPAVNRIVHDCTLHVDAGEALGLVGESGSGKTLSTRSIVGLTPEGLSVGGDILIDGINTATLTPIQLRELRANHVGMIFQTPRAHLNPLRTIGDFLTEALISVAGKTTDEAEKIAVELLDEVGISEPRRRLRQRPSQLSGGILQRVAIAAALAMEPRILLADEITTALDVTTQEEVMALIGELRRDRGLAMLFITHDLTLAQAVCDRITVMQHGRTIETLSASTLQVDAAEPYTRKLLAAVSAPTDAHSEAQPATQLAEDTPVLTVEALRKTFSVRAENGHKRENFLAVDDVSFALRAGESLGIVGESGSGKSTTARIICGLENADSGTVNVRGTIWKKAVERTRARRARARAVQMVFQDPYQSLDRRQTVRECLVEALRVHAPRMAGTDIDARVSELMASVRLDPDLADRRPRSLSGGQRQRVAIARALAADPEILVLDEAVSALDVTTQVEILSVLDGIRRETGVALLMISHDLNTVRRLCDRVVVMHNGRVEEQGTITSVLGSPRTEYTRLLIDSIPREGWVPRRRRQTVGTSTNSTPLP